MMFKLIIIGILCTAGYLSAVDRYEAESAVVDENSIVKVVDNNASGGYYINMKEGTLTFKVIAEKADFYTIWSFYKVDDANGKIQNLSVNGSSCGQMSFPFTEKFVLVKSSSKVKLVSGTNTISFTKSWGWVNLDYIEITTFTDTPFSYSKTLVTPNASQSAKKIYSFICDNFQKKTISGVMTNNVFQNDGKYTPYTVDDQTELSWIKTASGKTPALVGFDFLHGTGLSSDNQWHIAYTSATLSMAENVFNHGGIPAYTWHWMDPSKAVEAFYTKSSGNTPFTTFDIKKAFTDTVKCEEYNTGSSEYKAIVENMDTTAVYLKKLAVKGIAVIWRPMHEASGKWFWWGAGGPKPCVGIYRLMFDRFVNYHKLDNLIWLWTTDEAGDALDWYPGDEYVDIVGRDYYYYPREANHGSLVASFEKVKEIFGGRKIVTLSECGSVPHPDSLVGDGSGWSFFMPWYGDYTMDGWAHDNTAADWKSIMNNNYVITLDKMPGWGNYAVSNRMSLVNKNQNSSSRLQYKKGYLELILHDNLTGTVELYNIKGRCIAVLSDLALASGKHQFDLDGIAKGIYFVKVKDFSGSRPLVQQLIVR